VTTTLTAVLEPSGIGRYRSSTGAWDPSAVVIPGSWDGYAWWENVPVPNGAALVSATVQLGKTPFTGQSFRLAVADTGDAPHGGSGTRPPHGDKTPLGSFAGSTTRTITDQVRATLDRPDWQPGNTLGLFIFNESSSNFTWTQATLTLEFTPPPPLAAFTHTVGTGGHVSFTDASTVGHGQITEWAWDFGDGNTSTDQHPTHDYATPGTYQVTLTVTADTDQTATTTGEVVVAPWELRATITQTEVAGRTITVTGHGEGPAPVVSYLWDLGDGTTRTGPTLTHTYTSAGTYQVTLTVTDSVDDTATTSVTVETVELTDRHLLPPGLWEQVANARSRTIAAMVEVIDNAGTVLATMGGHESTHRAPIAGRITWDRRRHVRWSCDLEVNDPTLIPTNATDLLHPASHNRFRVWWMLQLPDGTWGRECVGTYYPTDPAIHDRGHARMRISGQDAAHRLAWAKWFGTPPSVAGQTCSDAVQAIWQDRVPNVHTRITHTDTPLPGDYEIGAPGEDPNEDVTRIAEAAGMEWYVDRMGVLTLTHVTRRLRAMRQFTEGDDCIITDLSRELSLEEAKNVVVVSSSSAEVVPPVTWTAMNTDPSSALDVDRGWWLVADPIESGEITTTAQAKALAEAELDRYTALTELIELRHRPDPTLGEGDMVPVHRDEAGVSGQYEVQSWQLDLGGWQTTTMVERRVRV